MPPVDGISIRVVGADVIAERWRRASSVVDDQVHEITKMMTTMLVQNVRSKASRPPGPRMRTGEYVRSIKGEVVRDRDTSVGIVYSEADQARRLELGFVGMDILGRHYNQPPFPHWRLAHEEMEYIYSEAIGGTVIRII